MQKQLSAVKTVEIKLIASVDCYDKIFKVQKVFKEVCNDGFFIYIIAAQSLSKLKNNRIKVWQFKGDSDSIQETESTRDNAVSFKQFLETHDPETVKKINQLDSRFFDTIEPSSFRQSANDTDRVHYAQRVIGKIIVDFKLD